MQSKNTSITPTKKGMLAILIFILIMPVAISVAIPYFTNDKKTSFSLLEIILSGMGTLVASLIAYHIIYAISKEIYKRFVK